MGTVIISNKVWHNFFVFVGTVNIYNNVWYVVVDNVMSVYMMVNVVCANICVVDNGQCSGHE